MKIRRINSAALLLLGLGVAACSSADDLATLTTEREGKVKERDELNDAIKELDQKIKVLDTNDVQVYFDKVTVDTLRKDFFEHRVQLEGTVEMDANALVNCEVQGILQKLDVVEGDYIRAGQLIAVIDDQGIRDNIAELKEREELAKYMLNKQEALRNKGIGTELDYETAKSEYQSVQASLNSLQTQLSKFKVRAPFSGWVDEIFIKVGEMASPQGPILRLINLDNAKITAQVSERYIPRVKVGDRIEFTVPVLRDTLMQARVTSVGKFVNPTNRTITVRAEVRNNKLLLPNMVIKTRIKDAEYDSVYVVEKKSIVENARQEEFVYVLGDFDTETKTYEVKAIKIQRLASEGNYVAIESSELEPNMQVVLGGRRKISEGDKVQILEDE